MASNITAQSVLEEISLDHLECPICTERFEQPRLLECSHSFCLECLQQLRQNSPSYTKLSCPVCRQETLLKENGIDGLKKNLTVVSLIDAIEKQETQLNQPQGKQLPSQEYISKCSKHKGKDLNMFCNNCNKVICTTCIVRDHQSHHLMEIDEALVKCKQHASELVANVRKRMTTFTIAIQEIDTSRKTLDSMFAATKDKISKKADEETAKEVARIREEKQKLMQEAEQIYKDRVKTMETAQATNSTEMNKAELKQDEVNQFMDQGINIVYHIEQLLQDLKVYREMTSTKVPDGLTYMDFKEGHKSLGRLVLKNEQVESATLDKARMPTFQFMRQNKWTLKSKINKYKNRKNLMIQIYPLDVAAYFNSDIVVLHVYSNMAKCSLVTKSAEINPQSTVIPQELPIKGLNRPGSVTVNKNDQLIFLDNGIVKIFNRNNQLLHQLNPRRWPISNPSCNAVDDNNLIAVGYCNKAEISLHNSDGSLRTLPAPGIGRHLTTYKQLLIYTSRDERKLVSVDYNGEVVFSVDVYQSGMPRGVCCYKDGSIYMCVEREEPLSCQSTCDIHQYSPDGKYIRCIIKDCVGTHGITLTTAGDLVLATHDSVQIYQLE